MDASRPTSPSAKIHPLPATLPPMAHGSECPVQRNGQVTGGLRAGLPVPPGRGHGRAQLLCALQNNVELLDPHHEAHLLGNAIRQRRRQEDMEVGERVATGHYKRNDVLLRKVLSETLFSFATNKRIFNSILLLGRMEKWQGVISTVSSLSRYVLEENDRQEYTALSKKRYSTF